jgi:hypothetical protein
LVARGGKRGTWGERSRIAAAGEPRFRRPARARHPDPERIALYARPDRPQAPIALRGAGSARQGQSGTVTEEAARTAKDRWELAATRIGVVAGAIGLLVAVLGLPKQVADVFGHSHTRPNAIDQQRLAALADAGPRLDVSYLIMTGELVQDDRLQLTQRSARATEARTVRSYPILDNQVLDAIDDPPHENNCDLGINADIMAAFLVVSNRGRRDATRIAIRVTELRLDTAVALAGPASRVQDPAELLRARSRSHRSVVVRVPRALAPGDGVRLPLFVSEVPLTTHGPSCVVSRTPLTPVSTTVTDPVLGTTKTEPIRRMVEPMTLGQGLVARG